MCTTLYFYFCIPYSMVTTKNLASIHHHTVDPLYPFCSAPSPLIITTPVCIYVFVFVWFVHLFIYLIDVFMVHIVLYF